MGINKKIFAVVREKKTLAADDQDQFAVPFNQK